MLHLGDFDWEQFGAGSIIINYIHFRILTLEQHESVLKYSRQLPIGLIHVLQTFNAMTLNQLLTFFLRLIFLIYKMGIMYFFLQKIGMKSK